MQSDYSYGNIKACHAWSPSTTNDFGCEIFFFLSFKQIGRDVPLLNKDSVEWIVLLLPALTALTERRGCRGWQRETHKMDCLPRYVALRLLNHSMLFKKLFRVFVSSGEFPTSDGGDLTAVRRRFYLLARFTSLRFHVSVSQSEGLASLHDACSPDLQSALLSLYDRALGFWSTSTLMCVPLGRRRHWHLAKVHTLKYRWHIFPVPVDRLISHHLSP